MKEIVSNVLLEKLNDEKHMQMLYGLHKRNIGKKIQKDCANFTSQPAQDAVLEKEDCRFFGLLNIWRSLDSILIIDVRYVKLFWMDYFMKGLQTIGFH